MRQLYTQAFGSLGGVVARYRTAKVLQTIMLELFNIPVFVYVDDIFWVMPDLEHPTILTAEFLLAVFKEVMTELLGWELDPEKEAVGKKIPLLGLVVSLTEDASLWLLDLAKRSIGPSRSARSLGRQAHHPPHVSACSRLREICSMPLESQPALLGTAGGVPPLWQR